jgi:hypothetical protein
MMKTALWTALIISALSSGLALAEEPNKPSTGTSQTAPTQNTPSTQIQQQNADPSLLMKIQQDDQDDAVRRKALIEDLRKLYKANFL